MIVLSHKIQIKNPTVKQEQYFRQACGTSRFAYNWGLVSLQKQYYEAGKKPTARTVRIGIIGGIIGVRVKLIWYNNLIKNKS
jgi:hypothetical protein